ncbi:MAG: adenylate kinase [Actinomycetota bacterium]
MRLVIFGPQGAGKGTQGARLSEKYDIPDVSTGDIFRWAIRGSTSLGNKVRDFVEQGRLVPDELTIEVVMERLSADDAQEGFLIDGYPRNIEQAQALEDFLEERGASLDAALVIDVPEEVSLRRLLGRRVCTKCGRNYHVDNPPQEDWICDRCGGKVEPGIDDGEEETIRGRLGLYHEQTEPLKELYREKGLLREVHGVGSQDEVFERIVSSL